jgi:hypothetical protein
MQMNPDPEAGSVPVGHFESAVADEAPHHPNVMVSRTTAAILNFRMACPSCRHH